MADLKVEFNFTTTFTAKEFSVVTRALAGHELKLDDKTLAAQLNAQLLKLRVAQLSQYAKQSNRALAVAQEESQAILGKPLVCPQCGCGQTCLEDIMPGCHCVCHD